MVDVKTNGVKYITSTANVFSTYFQQGEAGPGHNLKSFATLLFLVNKEWWIGGGLRSMPPYQGGIKNIFSDWLR